MHSLKALPMNSTTTASGWRSAASLRIVLKKSQIAVPPQVRACSSAPEAARVKAKVWRDSQASESPYRTTRGRVWPGAIRSGSSRLGRAEGLAAGAGVPPASPMADAPPAQRTAARSAPTRVDKATHHHAREPELGASHPIPEATVTQRA